MPKPLTVEIPHQLGRAEARKRLVEGVAQAQEMLKKSGISVADATWTEDLLAFAVAAAGQRIDGQIDVGEDAVRLEMKLPWLLAMLAQKVQQGIQKQGTLLLTKK